MKITENTQKKVSEQWLAEEIAIAEREIAGIVWAGIGYGEVE